MVKFTALTCGGAGLTSSRIAIPSSLGHLGFPLGSHSSLILTAYSLTLPPSSRTHIHDTWLRAHIHDYYAMLLGK